MDVVNNRAPIWFFGFEAVPADRRILRWLCGACFAIALILLPILTASQASAVTACPSASADVSQTNEIRFLLDGSAAPATCTRDNTTSANGVTATFVIQQSLANGPVQAAVYMAPGLPGGTTATPTIDGAQSSGGCQVATVGADTFVRAPAGDSCAISYDLGSGQTLTTTVAFTGSIMSVANTKISGGNFNTGAVLADAPQPNITVYVNAATRFQPVEGSGGDGNIQYQLTAGTLPSGLTFHQDTGVIDGTPTVTQAATNYTVRAFDGNGQSDSASFTLAVSLQPQTITFNPPGPQVYSPGGTTTVSASGGGSGNPVTFTSATTGVCTTSGPQGTTVNFVTAGTCAINANQAGSSQYAPAAQVQKSFLIRGAGQTINFSPIADQTYAPAGPVALVATGGQSGNPVTFVSNTTSICTVSGNNAVMQAVGICKITASQAGNGNYEAAPDVIQTFNINPASQTLTFNQPANQAFVQGGTFTVSATPGASGQPVYFSSSTTGVCTVVSNTGVVTMISVGTCTLIASEGMSTNYSAASDVTRSLQITAGGQVITFNQPPNRAFVSNSTFTVSATGGLSGNSVTFTSTTPAVCTTGGTDGTVITMVAVGTCSLTANQLGNANYAAAAPVSRSFQLTVAGQTITFTSTPPNPAVAKGPTYTVTATGGPSGNPVIFGLSPASAGICSISGQVVSFLAAGTCTVFANQAGNANYTAAVQVSQSITVTDIAGPTAQAIGSFISDRAGLIVSNMFSMTHNTDRLDDARASGDLKSNFDGTTDATSTSVAPGFARNSTGSAAGTSIPSRALMSGGTGMQDFFGLQALLYQSMQQLGNDGGINHFNYNGAFDASVMNGSSGFTGSFRTSMSQMMKWQANFEAQRASSMGINSLGMARGGYGFAPLDIWVEGNYSGYNGNRNGEFGLFTVGSDYVINKDLLVGFFTQIDVMNQRTGPAITGKGWMAGPYATVRLADELFLHLRAAGGRSENTMGGLSNKFFTSRILASAEMEGRWRLDNGLGFSPNLKAAFITETSDAMTVAGAPVATAAAQVGQISFSPAITWGFNAADNVWVEPAFTPELIYNSSITTLGDSPLALPDSATAPAGFRGKLKAGISVRTASGIALSTSGSYDGFGTKDYRSYGAQARIDIPLN